NPGPKDVLRPVHRKRNPLPKRPGPGSLRRQRLRRGQGPQANGSHRQTRRQGARSRRVKTSKDRIITTHVGSMVRPPEIQDIMRKKEAGQPYDQAALEAKLKTTVADVVKRQKDIGIDVPSDGEFSKSSFSNYANERL